MGVFAENTEVRANRVDARIINHETRSVTALKMSCPWLDNRSTKDAEKTLKYGPLRWELKQQYPGYKVKQYNIIIDELGGWSKELEKSMKEFVGVKGGKILRRMQKAVLSHSLNIARSFKILI